MVLDPAPSDLIPTATTTPPSPNHHIPNKSQGSGGGVRFFGKGRDHDTELGGLIYGLISGEDYQERDVSGIQRAGERYGDGGYESDI